jgi:predicted lipoprotein with Yx(FWY)xxD motif
MNRTVLIGGGAAVALVAGISIAIAATSSGASDSGGSKGGGSGGGYGAAAGSGPARGTAATVGTARTKLGAVLVDGRGRTLYLFESDRPDRSTCANACASVWPPLTTTGAPRAGSGARAGDLGTLHRGDGSTQVTYHGHPLYLYAGDRTAGATNGQGLDQFGAEWYVLSPAGAGIDDD